MTMRDHFWISPEDLIDINLEVGGEGAGVFNLEGIRGNAERPFTDVFGHKEFPTVWDEAACLLHGIASTQYFHDGNKRTAWEACRHYLQFHGHTLRPMPWMNKGAAIMTAAVNALSIPEIAQWLYVNRLTAQDRVGHAVLGLSNGSEDGTVGKINHQFPAQIIGHFEDPGVLVYTIISRINWFAIDGATHKTVKVELEAQSGEPEIITEGALYETEGMPEPMVQAQWAPHGYQPWTHTFVLPVRINGGFDGYFKILINGEEAWRDHVNFTIDAGIASI